MEQVAENIISSQSPQIMTDSDLPRGWVNCLAGDVFIRISNGASFEQFNEKIGLPISRIETIWNETIDFTRVKYIKETDLSIIARYKLERGDILFSHINSDSHLGKTAIFNSESRSLIHGINLLLLRPSKLVVADFINYQFKYLRSGGVFVDIAQRAVNQSSINQQKLRKVEIKLPPVNEQKKIVSKIDELFSDLDTSIENLNSARAQLNVYRQSLLKCAFEGRLTKQWRTENKNKLKNVEDILDNLRLSSANDAQLRIKRARRNKELLPVDSGDTFDIPEDWRFEQLAIVADIIGGITKGKKYGDQKTVQLAYLRVANVQDGYLDLKLIKTIESLPSDLAKYRLVAGDILYTEGGDRDKLGRGTIWKDEIPNCIHQNHIFRARLRSTDFEPKYIAYYSRTRSAKDYFFKHGKQTTNLASINLTVLSNFPVPIPSPEEQREIVSLLEDYLSWCDRLDTELENSIEQSASLRQSILKYAFEGKLVQQDPNDEPASVLLSRLKLELSLANGNGAGHKATRSNGKKK